MNRQQAYSWLTANTLSREQIVAGLQQVQVMNSMNNYHGAGMHNMMMPPNFPTFQGEIMAVANERKEVEQHDNASSSSVSPAPPSLLPFEKRQVGPNDVLNGRTKLSFNHVGNRRFRKLIGQSADEYNAAPSRIEKYSIVDTIVSQVRRAGGSFLKLNELTGEWEELEHEQIRLKIAHAIRDTTKKREARMKKESLREEAALASNMANEALSLDQEPGADPFIAAMEEQLANSSSCESKPKSRKDPPVTELSMCPAPKKRAIKPISPPPASTAKAAEFPAVSPTPREEEPIAPISSFMQNLNAYMQDSYASRPSTADDGTPAERKKKKPTPTLLSMEVGMGGKPFHMPNRTLKDVGMDDINLPPGVGRVGLHDATSGSSAHHLPPRASGPKYELRPDDNHMSLRPSMEMDNIPIDRSGPRYYDVSRHNDVGVENHPKKLDGNNAHHHRNSMWGAPTMDRMGAGISGYRSSFDYSICSSGSRGHPHASHAPAMDATTSMKNMPVRATTPTDMLGMDNMAAATAKLETTSAKWEDHHHSEHGYIHDDDNMMSYMIDPMPPIQQPYPDPDDCGGSVHYDDEFLSIIDSTIGSWQPEVEPPIYGL